MTSDETVPGEPSSLSIAEYLSPSTFQVDREMALSRVWVGLDVDVVVVDFDFEVEVDRSETKLSTVFISFYCSI